MMNSLTREGKFIVFGRLAVILLAAGIYFYYIANRGPVGHPQPASEELIKQNAIDTLKHVVDVANEVSGITSGAVFNFEVDDLDGRSANFGVYRLDSEVGGESLAEEHFVTFRNQNYTSEVAHSGGVVVMHRPVPEFAKSGDAYPAEQLEATAREFMERIYPEFANIESKLEYDPGSKSAPGVVTNHFFRWNDKNYRKTMPSGVEIDLDPFIQVGITANGFIFSYDNTVPLYWSCEAWDSPSCIPTE